MSTADYSFRARNNRRQGRSLTNFKTDNPYTSLGFPTTDASMATSARNGRGLFYTNGAAQVETPTTAEPGPGPAPPVGANWVVYGMGGGLASVLNGASLTGLSPTNLSPAGSTITNILYANSIWVLGGRPSTTPAPPAPPNSFNIFYGSLEGPPDQIPDTGINYNITNIFYENSNWVICGNISDGTSVTSSVVIQGASLDDLSPVTLGIGPIVNAVYTSGTWAFGGDKLNPTSGDNSTVLFTNTLVEPSPLSVDLTPYNMATLTNLLYLNNTWLIAGTSVEGYVLLLSGASLVDPLTTLDLTTSISTIQNILYGNSTWAIYGNIVGAKPVPVILQGSSLTSLTAVSGISTAFGSITNVLYADNKWVAYGDNVTPVILQGATLSSLTAVSLTGLNIGSIRNIVYRDSKWFVCGISTSGDALLLTGAALTSLTPVSLTGFDIDAVDGVEYRA